MRRLPPAATLAILCAASLAACLTPPMEPATPTQDGAPTEAPAAATPPPPPPAGAPGTDGRPSFETIIGDGASVEVRGAVEGATTGQVDFIVASGDIPEIVHVAPVSGGRFSTRVPAGYPTELWINAISYEEGGQPEPSSPSGGLRDPLRIGTEDLELTIRIGDYDLMADRFRPPAEAPSP